jgi:hypothetical protein
MGLSEEEYHNIRILNVSPFYVSTKMTGFWKKGFDTVDVEDYVANLLKVFNS